MPVTRGLQCAYCNIMVQSDYQMDIHLKEHKQEIKDNKEFIAKETERLYKKKNGLV